MYLTYADYQNIFTGNDALTNADFSTFEPYAEQALDHITNHFYAHNDLATDPSNYRSGQFKKAMAWEINYMQSRNIKTQAELDNDVSLSSQNIGGISLSTNSTTTGGAFNLVSSDVQQILFPTGLIYRGIEHEGINHHVIS